MIQREWQRIDPKYLDEDEQRFWATIAGRQMRFDERQSFVQKFTAQGASKGALETFLATCAAQNPNRRLRLIALADRVSMRVDRADFDDLVTLVTQAPPWEKDRSAGVRLLLRAIAEGKPDAPEQILARWTWKLARAVRKTLDRKASQEYPDAKRLLGALANSRGQRHEENAARLVKAALEMPREVGAALLATAEGYTPRATNAARRGARAARHDPGDRRRARRRPARRRRRARRARAGAGAAKKKRRARRLAGAPSSGRQARASGAEPRPRASPVAGAAPPQAAPSRASAEPAERPPPGEAAADARRRAALDAGRSAAPPGRGRAKRACKKSALPSRRARPARDRVCSPGSSRRSRPASCRCCRSCSPAAPRAASRCGSSPGSSQLRRLHARLRPGSSTSSGSATTCCATSRSRSSSSLAATLLVPAARPARSSGPSPRSRASAPAAAASCSAPRSGSSSSPAPGPVLADDHRRWPRDHRVGAGPILLTTAYAVGAALPMLAIASAAAGSRTRLRAHAAQLRVASGS